MSPEVRRRRRSSRLQRALRHLRHKPSRPVWIGALAVVVLGALWCGFTAWQAARDLDEVNEQGQILRARLVAGDPDGARRALAAYQEAAESAESRTDGPTWWLAERLPLLGDDAAGVATVSGVLADLGRDGLPPLVEAAESVTAGSFNPTGQRFPLETIEAVKAPAKRSEQAFADAADELSTVDPGGFIGPIGSRYDELESLVLTARSTLDSAYRAAELMPELLGADGRRHYLMVLQNNAELRSLGGLTGSISLVRAEGGKVDIVAQEGTSQFGYVDPPVLDLTRDETRLFGDRLGQYFMNASLTPDAPRAAELMAARWEREQGGRVDGVFFVDPVAVSYLLSATGPVPVPGYQPVDSATVVQEVENRIYLATTNRAEQEDFQNAVAEAVFDTFAAGAAEPAGVIANLVRGVAEGRIRMHSFQPAVQEEIAGTEIAGELPTAEDDATVGVYVNDGLESKMSYYLDYDVTAVARACAGQVQDVAGTLTVTNDVPEGERLPVSVTGIFPGARYFGQFEPGQQRVVVYLMSTPGGTVEELAFDGRLSDAEPATVPFEGRQVAAIELPLDVGETRSVEFVIRTAPGQTGPIEVAVTPGARAGTESQTLRSSC